MADQNKNNLITFLKVVAIGLLSAVAIVTSAGVWNAVAAGAIGSFYGWVAGGNIAAGGVGSWLLYKKLFSK